VPYDPTAKYTESPPYVTVRDSVALTISPEEALSLTTGTTVVLDREVAWR
jgi:hypothetical protein